MRLLHIADLHAGKRLYEHISRKEDLLYALQQVEDICKEEKVNVLLVAGDIFDKKAPDFESQNIIMEFFIELCTSGIHVVAIAGNHDSYDFMKVHRNLRKLTNIHVFDRPVANPSEAVLQIDNLKIACLPYPDEKVITDLNEERYRDYSHKVASYMKALAKQVEDAQYRILLAHLMVDKATVAGSELYSSISPMYAVKAESIPEDFQYVALGHVHKNQRIEGPVPKVYYAGSLYQINFSEKGMDKFVNLLILEDNMVKVETKRLDLKRQLIELHIGERDNIQQSLEPFAKRDVLVKVRMGASLRDPYFNYKKEMVQKILGEKLARLEIETIDSGAKQVRTEEGLSLVELYKDFYKKEYGSDAPNDLLKVLEKLIHRATHETHQT
ncbi:MAG: exonuclease SbcCD subunit D [Aquificaceae bacterium]|nr:exonuclease SbcCD subunit D [Aquificaceae bacterium]